MNQYGEGPFWDESTPLPPENALFGEYKTSLQIASTNCSMIYLGYSVQDGSKKALKFIKKIPDTLHRLRNEIETMRTAQHPYILKIENIFPYSSYVCIVTPFAASGSLHRLVQAQYPNGVPETLAKIMFRQMLEAVNYLHGINIWHRDIKLDNFLVFDNDINHPIILLSDFGFAKLFQNHENGTEYIGTPEFAAPEMYLNKPYDKSIDIWSLGITLYVMLACKYPVPCYKSAPRQCTKRIITGNLNYSLLRYMDVSSDAIDLIQRMCQVDPNERITAEDALKHPWIVSQQKETEFEGDVANALWKGEEFYDSDGGAV